MQSKCISALITGLSLMVVATAVFAHHGRAAYGTNVVSFEEATITEFRFINPHTQIYFDVTSEDGEVQQWKAELTAPNRLARSGWTKTILQPGDKVKINGHQAANGSNAMRLIDITLSDGTVLDPWTSGTLPPLPSPE